jgi:hypothetical protein
VGGARIPGEYVPKDPAKRAKVLEALFRREEVIRAKAELEARQDELAEAVREASNAGVAPTVLAQVLGMSRARIHQILGKGLGSTRSSAQKRSRP